MAPFALLTLWKCKWKEGDFAEFRGHLKLTRLVIRQTSLTREEFDVISNLGQLRMISLADIQCSEEISCTFDKFDSLQWLRLEGSLFADKQAMAFLKNTSLKVVKLPRTSITDLTLSACATLSRMKELDLSDTAINGSGFADWKNEKSPILEHLEMRNTNLDSAGLMSLAVTVSVEWLDISHTKVTDAALQKCPQIKSLEILSLRGLTLSAAVKKHLQDRYYYVSP
ncbi:leucine-rich repeat domain-containing protein [Lignipirellula cremea]|uniref:hypothetical protein n=1 Tax=Lignipirellula cremea TaxID=2528010 RepID=UPI00119EADFF|nr:hypothetical protein [Lignipirellula cremea]